MCACARQRPEDVPVRAWHCATVKTFLTQRGVHRDTVQSLYAARVNGDDLTDDARIQEVYAVCEYLSDSSWNVLERRRTS